MLSGFYHRINGRAGQNSVTDEQLDQSVRLFSSDLLSDPGSRGFSVRWQEQSIEGFVICRDQQFYAYLNSCPHTGSPLDWVDHQFLDLDEEYIQCAMHDARFEIETGLCVAGPCPGARLQPLEVAVVDDQVVLTVGAA